MPDFGKTSAKFIIALLKHQAKLWLGEETVGIAAGTVIDEDLQKRLDGWLQSDETAKKLIKAAQTAQEYLLDPKNCPDADLRQVFHDIGFGDLPSIQKAVSELPESLDSGKIEQILFDSFARDLPNLSAEQHHKGARLYTDAFLRAVGTLEQFVSPILLQTALDLKKGQYGQDKKLDKIIALLQERISNPPTTSSLTQKGDLPLGSYLPIQPNPFFTGREAELTQLANALLAENGGAVINQQALIGMGGVGKTQLAVQFAWQEGYRFAGVHWVSAFKADEIAASIALCGGAMGLQPWPQDVDQQADLTINAWKANGTRLVMLDNLEDVTIAAAWMAKLRHTNIRILITTRQKDWPPAFGLRGISLPTFTQTESIAFLRRYLDETRASEADLAALHTRFGGLPLPLDLAASYLQHVEKLSAQDYLQQLSLDHPSLKNWRAKYPTATQHDKDVAASFALSWERVEDDAARKLFLLAGYALPNEPLLQDVLQAASQLDDEPYSEALDLLKGLSLLQPEPSLHPLLADFARLQDADHAALFEWSRTLAWRGYPGFEHGGLYRDPNLARVIRLSLPDLLHASALAGQDAATFSNFCFHTAFLLTHFGDLDGAMKLYQQALDIKEGLGDLQGKSATLHAMANIFVTRGDLDGAMKLYQQAREILEGLGDLKGKSATLINMGVVLFQNDRHVESLSAILSGLQILIQLGAKLDIETVIGLLKQFQQAVGAEAFARLWKQATDSEELPEWLASQTSEDSESSEVSVEQFIAGAIQSAKEKNPNAEQFFEAAQKMAADPSAPLELQDLGKALQRIMLGDKDVDLSGLPEAWVELIKSQT